MNALTEMVRWFGDSANWVGTAGVPTRLVEHIELSAAAVAIAGALALPFGLYIGHTGRGEFVAVSAANLGRAIPSFGILAFVFPFTLRYLPGFGFWPTLIAMFLLAIPPILTNTYVGIKNVDRDTVEAARGMGMSEGQILARIELPLAAPLVVAGLRTAAVQVIATATLGAFVAWGGLGRFIVDGFAQQDHGMILAGAVLVAALAIVAEISLAIVERAVTPRRTSVAEARESLEVEPQTA
jgi:osmoprotectant transport system permease protein